MKLTAGQVFDATLTVSQIIRENRPMPQKGKYRLARLHAKLLPEFNPISVQRDEIIASYDHLNADGAQAVPEDKMPEFLVKWREIADQVIDVDVEPIPFDQIDNEAGSISASELIVLGALVADPG